MAKASNLLFMLIALVAISISSCENVVTVDLGNDEPKLVTFCILNNTDKVPKVHVTNTISTTEGGVIEPIEGADVRITSNDLNIDNFTYTVTDYATWSDYYNEIMDAIYIEFNNTQYDWQANETYNLQVSATGYESITAEIKFPPLVNIQSIDTSHYYGNFEPLTNIDGDAYDYWQLEIEISDPPNQDNYYYLIVRNEAEGKLSISSPDIKVGQYLRVNNVLYFKDNLFDGETLKLRFLVDAYYIINNPEYYEEWKNMEITLASVNKDLYLYQTSRKLQNEGGADDEIGGIFTEPVIVHNNIVNGYGIFAAEQKDFRTINFE